MSDQSRRTTGIVFAFCCILLANYILYYFIIKPFAFVYRLGDHVSLRFSIGLAAAIMIGFFIHLRNSDILDMSTFGMGKTYGTQNLNDPAREIGIIMDDLRIQINTENIGSLDLLYNQVFDLAMKLPEGKKRAALIKANNMKNEIDDLKKKYQIA